MAGSVHAMFWRIEMNRGFFGMGEDSARLHTFAVTCETKSANHRQKVWRGGVHKPIATKGT